MAGWGRGNASRNESEIALIISPLLEKGGSIWPVVKNKNYLDFGTVCFGVMGSLENQKNVVELFPSPQNKDMF